MVFKYVSKHYFYYLMLFVLASCSKTLDSGSVQENSGNPYCKSCYGKNFGPKGYGFGGGGAGLSSNSYGDGDESPRYNWPCVWCWDVQCYYINPYCYVILRHFMLPVFVLSFAACLPVSDVCQLVVHLFAFPVIC